MAGGPPRNRAPDGAGVTESAVGKLSGQREGRTQEQAKCSDVPTLCSEWRDGPPWSTRSCKGSDLLVNDLTCSTVVFLVISAILPPTKKPNDRTFLKITCEKEYLKRITKDGNP